MPCFTPNFAVAVPVIQRQHKPSQSALRWITIAHGPAHHDNASGGQLPRATKDKAKSTSSTRSKVRIDADLRAYWMTYARGNLGRLVVIQPK